MFDPASRYAVLTIKTLEVTGPDGQLRLVRYVERRFVPPLEGTTTLVEHVVAANDRLDQVAARYLGDPLQYWRVADANDGMRPEELTDEVGRRLAIALPRLQA